MGSVWPKAKEGQERRFSELQRARHFSVFLSRSWKGQQLPLWPFTVAEVW